MQNIRGYYRVFEPLLRGLAARGHDVSLAYDEHGTAEERRWLDDLAREYPSITFGPAPHRHGVRWAGFGHRVRRAADLLRFLGPEFAHCTDLRNRAIARAPRLMARPVPLWFLKRQRGRAVLASVLKRVERAIPSRADVEAFITAHHPDIVLVTPLLKLGSIQPDYLKGAQALGCRTMLCVASWDNLSSKALIRFPPDAVTVWNEIQKREAVDLHGVPSQRVVVTGAQNFDAWFVWKPRLREEFCGRVGLDPKKPYVMYVCSALFAASISEAEFVTAWIRRLRNSGHPKLAEAGILIRPHPKRGGDWKRDSAETLPPGVVVWPRTGAMPIGGEAKADYYDSMYHSAAVVGLNTTALIEAGIVGRPVHTLLAPEFSGSQNETLHFPYLTEIEGGLLRVAADFDEHARQLAEALDGVNWGEDQRRRFLEVFVRPHGLDVTSTSVFVNAIESLAKGERPKPVRPSTADRFLRLGLYPAHAAGKILVRIMLARRAARQRRQNASRRGNG